MFVHAVFISMFFTNIISCSQVNVEYTEEDYTVIRCFTRSLQISNLVFVTDSNDLDVIKYMKRNLYSVVISSGQLNEILNDESARNFLTTSSIIVSKGSFNYKIKFKKLSEKHSLVWVVFTNTLEPLQDFYVPMNTDLYTVRYTPRATVIDKAYNLKQDLNITWKSVGVWQREVADTILINRIRTYDFDGITLGMLHFLDVECENLKKLDFLNRIECFHQEILRILADKFNYKIGEIKCQERVYPYNFPNGSLADLFLMLDSKDVDLSSGSYIINEDRLDKYDYIWPVFTSRSMMYIKERKQNYWRGYLRPIHKHLWQAICIWIITVGFLYQLFEQCHGNRWKPRPSLLLDIIKSIFTSLQVFCNQGIHDLSKWYSIRILFLMSFFLFSIFYEVYSGFLISFLMVDVPSIPFTDISGFFQDGRFKLISLNKGFHNYFTNKIIDDLKQDRARFKLPPEQLPEKIEEGIKILCDGSRLTYIEFRENIAMYEIPCKLTELSHSLLSQSIGIGFRKYSPFVEPIKRGFISLKSSGIVQRMRKQLLSYANVKEMEISDEEYVKVSLKHVISIFFIWGVGMIFAWGVFLLEHLFIVLMKLLRKFKNKTKLTIGKPKLRVLHFTMGRNLFACICIRWPKCLLKKNDNFTYK